MKIPRNLSGADLAAVLCRSWGYALVHQRGSHLVLETENPFHHRVSIPNHSPLRIGTLNSILRAIAAHKGVERDDLLDTL